MKMLKFILTGVMAGWLAVTQPAFAEEPKQQVKQEQVKQTQEEKIDNSPIALDCKTNYLSKYIFRGFTYSEKPVIQQTLSATYRDFTLLGFGNFDTKNKEFNEADLILDYTKAVDSDLILSVGYTFLTFPNTEQRKTQEIYAGITLEKILKPSLKIVQDFDEGKGTYGELSIGHDLIVGKLGVLANAILGYNGHYFREDRGLSHAELRLAVLFQLGKNTALTPMINYSKSLDKKDFQDELYGGISISLTKKVFRELSW